MDSRKTLETQDLKILICGKTLETQDPERQNFDVSRLNPRPAGVWIVTRPAGGGGPKAPPPEISQTTGPISKFQTPFDSPVRELPVQGQTFDPEVTDDVTGQVSQNFRLFGLGDIGE